jgi:hypothetical protein
MVQKCLRPSELLDVNGRHLGFTWLHFSHWPNDWSSYSRLIYRAHWIVHTRIRKIQMLNCYRQLSSSVIFRQYGVSQSECKIDRPRPGLPRVSPRPYGLAIFKIGNGNGGMREWGNAGMGECGNGGMREWGEGGGEMGECGNIGSWIFLEISSQRKM